MPERILISKVVYKSKCRSDGQLSGLGNSLISVVPGMKRTKKNRLYCILSCGSWTGTTPIVDSAGDKASWTYTHDQDTFMLHNTTEAGLHGSFKVVVLDEETHSPTKTQSMQAMVIGEATGCLDWAKLSALAAGSALTMDFPLSKEAGKTAKVTCTFLKLSEPRVLQAAPQNGRYTSAVHTGNNMSFSLSSESLQGGILRLVVMDENRLKADRLIGEGQASIAQGMVVKKDATSTVVELMMTLYDEKKAVAGRVYVRATIDDEPAWNKRVSISRIQAKGLKNVELVGKNDPYVLLSFSETSDENSSSSDSAWTSRTPAIDDAGSEALWQFGPQERSDFRLLDVTHADGMSFTVKAESLLTGVLKLVMMDANCLEADMLIGAGQVSLSDSIVVSASATCIVVELSVTLYQAAKQRDKDKVMGRVFLRVNIEEEILYSALVDPTAESGQKIISISCIQATDIKIVDAFDKNDPYLLLSFNECSDGPVAWSNRTTTVDDAGSEALWQFGLQEFETFHLLDTAHADGKSFSLSSESLQGGILRLVVMDENRLKADRLIGEGQASIAQGMVVKKDATSTVVELMMTLYDKKKAVAGRVYVRATIEEAQIYNDIMNFATPATILPKNHAASQKIVSISRIQAKNLKNVEMMGKNDPYIVLFFETSSDASPLWKATTPTAEDSGDEALWRFGKQELGEFINLRKDPVNSVLLVLFLLSPLFFSVCAKALFLAIMWLTPARFEVQLNVHLVQLQLLLLVFLISQTYHRVIGVLLGCYIRALLGSNDANGKFLLRFEWVSFIFGWDKNEVVIHHFKWMNPPPFDPASYLLSIDTIRISINMASVYAAVASNGKSSIKIEEILLSRIHFYAEKGPNKILNIFAAMGAKNQVDEKELHDHCRVGILEGHEEVAKATIIPSKKKSLRPSSPVHMPLSTPASICTTAPTTTPVMRVNRGLKRVASMKGRYLNYHEGSDSDATSSSSDDETEETSDDKPTLSRFPALHHLYGHSPTAAQDTKESIINPVHDLLNTDDSTCKNSDPHNTSFASSHEHSTLAHDSQKKMQHTGGSGSNHESPASPLPPSVDSDHYGVPYLFEIDRIAIFNFTVHALDFVCATHKRKGNQMATEIVVRSTIMFRRDLTKPGLTKRSNRRGLYFDEVIWRLIGRMGKELMAQNSIAIMLLLGFGSAASASELMRGSLSIVTNTLETMAYGGGRLLELMHIKDKEKTDREIGKK